MSDHKRELALQRDRQLSKLRQQMDRPERFALPFACAERDLDYRISFARFSATTRFACEKIEAAAAQTALARLQGFFTPRGDQLSVPVAEIDFAGLACPGCGDRGAWTSCPDCGAFVCGRHSTPGAFRCRKSCGASFRTETMTEISAARPGGPTAAAIGRSGFTSLPKARR